MKIYLLSPYSHPDPRIRERRYDGAVHFAGRLMQCDFLVYSPIAHTHHIAERSDLPTGWDYWAILDTTFIRDWADAGVVIQLQGWDTSVGVKAEIDLFNELGKPVYFWNPLEDLPNELKERA